MFRHSNVGYRDHGTRLVGFKPLIMKPKPYRDLPDSDCDDSEIEEFNINISLDGSRAYRGQ